VDKAMHSVYNVVDCVRIECVEHKGHDTDVKVLTFCE
jgi:hypothetical protein